MLVRWENQEEVYPVVAISFDHHDNVTYLYFSDFGSTYSQYRHNMNEVEVVDATLPGYWMLAHDVGENTDYISFTEWINDLGKPGEPGFYERYVDGNPKDLETMQHYYDIEYKKYQDNPHLVGPMERFSKNNNHAPQG